ncbi:ABC transporter permease [Actinophytocola sp.]|uniref:ABC transporter permease n=1 Tax=Actinophytocola sp. TaxID=1872138 RepID=UPI002ED66CF7
MSDRPRTALLDVIGQALHAVRGRKARSALTVLGIALGIAMAAATVGISGSAAEAVSSRFDALEATQVGVRYPTGQPAPTLDDAARLRSLHGVLGAGLLCSRPGELRVAASRYATGVPLGVHAAETDALTALGAELVSGRWFDAGHLARGDAVVVVDTVTARVLGIDVGHVIFVDGRGYLVTGVFQAPAGEPRLTRAVVVGYSECLAAPVEGTYNPPEAAIRTQFGATDQVGAEAPYALNPRNPKALAVAVPPDLASFRVGVEGETRVLFLGLAAVSLLIGAIGIANTSYIAVIERRGEIGLRRSVGASRRAIGGQFLVESGLLGFVGGVLGTVLGIDITAATSLVKDWVVVLDPRLVAAGPLLGLVTGMLAGLYPAVVAARLRPAEALHLGQ